MKLSFTPRGPLAAGANAVIPRLENPFSYIPSGSLASGLGCQGGQGLCPRKKKYFYGQSDMLGAGKGGPLSLRMELV